MFEVVITGRLADHPDRRIARSGKPYTVAKINVLADGALEAFTATVVDFAESILRFRRGDSVLISGSARLTLQPGKGRAPDRPGLHVVARDIEVAPA